MERFLLKFKDIEKLRSKIISDKKDPNQDFEDFKTDSGKDFEQNLQDLSDFMYSILFKPIFLTNELTLWRFFKETLEFVFNSSFKILENKNITKNEINEIKQSIIKLSQYDLNKILKNRSVDENSFSDVNLYDHMISHYIISLYAYLDLSSMSLYQLVVSKMSEDEIFEVVNSFKPRENPKKRINNILKNLYFLTKRELKNLFQSTTWETNIDKLIELRDEIAHKKPLTKIQTLYERFPQNLKESQSFVKKELKKSKSEMKAFFETMKERMELLFTLMSIGEEYLCYLLMIDIIVYSHLKNK